MSRLTTILTIGFLLVFVQVYAQEERIPKERIPVERVFNNKQLINAQTTEMPTGFEFIIQHRFGQISWDKSIVKDFVGSDLVANIRIALAYAINEKWYVGIGRTKTGKTYDLEGKYRIFQQTTDNRFPFSMVVYLNGAINTDKDRVLPENVWFGDSITPFENKFIHRIDYTSELIFSRQFTDKFAMQCAVTMIYKNLVVGTEHKHATWALPVSAAYRLTRGTTLLFEYTRKLNNRIDYRDHPFSLGFEFGTASHVFQLFVATTSFLREANLYTRPSYDFLDSEFIFGFNIRRTWWFKRK